MAAYFVRGSTLEAGPQLALTPDNADAVVLAGNQELRQEAASATFVPDVDGDGVDEVALNLGRVSSSLGGGKHAVVISGATLLAGVVTTLDDGIAQVKSTDWVYGGTALLGLQDPDGDGTGELLVGDPNSAEEAVRLYLGADLLGGGVLTSADAHAVWQPPVGSGVLGGSLAALGDLDGDGLPDFAMGGGTTGTPWSAMSPAGVVWGADALAGGTVPWSAVDTQLSFGALGAQTPVVGQPLGDLDGDGLPDLVLTSDQVDGPAGGSSGRTVVVPGSQLLAGGSIDLAASQACVEGEQAYRRLGVRAGGVPNLDGDGVPDLYTTITWFSTTESAVGAVAVFSGVDLLAPGCLTLEDAEHLIVGELRDDRIGDHAAVALDADGDGWSDLAFSAVGRDVDSTHQAGTVFVFVNPR